MVLRLPCRSRWARQLVACTETRENYLFSSGSRTFSDSGRSALNQDTPIWVPERLTRKLTPAIREDETTNTTTTTGNDDPEQRNL
ncbi:uncharacterized protein LOC134481222 [Rattus norvegicus]|uniref:uncharacterized protein LOC134481222 n=1 Tax=Rattus norvegicus TaxID=10116 RepID=UPI002FD80F58